ncbi:MAG: acyl-CoA dehydrogenase, partial [Deltaproteobacteria bacterium]
MRYRGVDFYGIEALLSEEERMVRDTVRNFVSNEVLPIIREHNRAGTFPVALIPKLAALGVLGANLTGYGCAGMNNVAYGLVMQ